MFLLLLAMAAHVANEEKLLRRLRRGDTQALAELYDAYSTLVYRLILRIVRDPGVAEELVQETFLKVWRRINLLDEGARSLGPWIVTIARNRALDYLDSAKLRTLPLESFEYQKVFSAIDEVLMNSPQARELRAAVGRLKPNQRSVIELAYYEGLSYSEVAARLNRPLGTVKTWVRSALRGLRQDLGRREDHEIDL